MVAYFKWQNYLYMILGGLGGLAASKADVSSDGIRFFDLYRIFSVYFQVS